MKPPVSIGGWQVSWLPDVHRNPLGSRGAEEPTFPAAGAASGWVRPVVLRLRLQWRGPRRILTGFPCPEIIASTHLCAAVAVSGFDHPEMSSIP